MLRILGRRMAPAVRESIAGARRRRELLGGVEPPKLIHLGRGDGEAGKKRPGKPGVEKHAGLATQPGGSASSAILIFLCGPLSSSLGTVQDITLTLKAMQRGEKGAADRLMQAVYEELHALAAAKLAKESTDSTLQPNELVHEAWLRIGGDHQTPWRNRAHFFCAAAEAMRRILIDRARRRRRIRRGGGQRPLRLDEIAEPVAVASAEHLLAVNEALERLAAADAKRAEVVKLRYFGGLTLKETAQVLGISESTAKRRWKFARAWLFREISI